MFDIPINEDDITIIEWYIIKISISTSKVTWPVVLLNVLVRFLVPECTILNLDMESVDFSEKSVRFFHQKNRSQDL